MHIAYMKSIFYACDFIFYLCDIFMTQHPLLNDIHTVCMLHP